MGELTTAISFALQNGIHMCVMMYVTIHTMPPEMSCRKNQEMLSSPYHPPAPDCFPDVKCAPWAPC